MEPTFYVPSTPTYNYPLEPTFYVPPTPTYNYPLEPTFYVPPTPTYNYPHTRTEAIEYFISNSFNVRQISNLCGIRYPQFTNNVVSEIASAKSIGFDLALLAFLPSIAAAERGKHIVTLSNELKNNLSCIFLVGAESGSGKGRALEESLSFFSNWEDDMIKRIKDINKRRSDENEIIEFNIKYLKKQYAKSLDPEILDLIRKEKDKLNDLLPDVYLLMNDISSAAYTQELIKNGIAIRLESDGIMLPDDTMRIVNKAWSGERNRRTRMSMPDGVIRDPFIVDLVMTQPDFFHRYISDQKFLESGRLARTLVYLYDATYFTPNQPAHEMDQQIRNQFYNKLGDLLRYSESSSEKMPIFVDHEAENIFFERERMWREQFKFYGELYKTMDFVKRMGQYTLRLAGILHLAENEVGSQTNINAETMQTAILMMEVFAKHTFSYRIKDYGEFNRKCCCDIMIYILKKNLCTVLETELKQALKHRYKAKDIEVGLHYLQRDRHLRQEDCAGSLYRIMYGRPKGRVFRNPYHELFGQEM